MEEVQYSQADDHQDLLDILHLQSANLPAQVDPLNYASQGFVTVEHELSMLREMNRPFPHTIARVGTELVGYALVMEERWRRHIAVLEPMFLQLDRETIAGKRLSQLSYFIMGQVCVEKTHRGKGIFKGLYQHLLSNSSAHFEYCITEIDLRNQRSILVHASLGFKELCRYTSDGREWSLVYIPCTFEW